MSSIYLTSAGFENPRIRADILSAIPRTVEESRVLFIPTAALLKKNYEYIECCKAELLEANFREDQIISHTLETPMNREEATCYDLIYVCGGNTDYLREQMNQANFFEFLETFLKGDGVYVGVSAGSIVLCGNSNHEKGLLGLTLKVHSEMVSCVGIIDDNRNAVVTLSDDQAIRIKNNIIEIIA